MAKQYKVKRYYGKNETSYRAKPHPVTIVLVILLFAGLGYLGTVIYKPAYDFIMNIGNAPSVVLPEPEIPIPPAASSSEPEKKPEPPPKPEYQTLRAVYIPYDTAADTNKLDKFLSEIPGGRINSVMIDIKNPAGEVLFKSKNEMAVKWGAIVSNAIDLKAFAAKLDGKGLSLIVRMSAFRDPKAASAGRLNYAINYQNSEFLWLDAAPENGGRPWLNPYSVLTQEYLNSIALEAVDAGAKMVVLENVQFPDNSAVYATFGQSAITMSRSEVLKTFVSNLAKRAEEKDVRVSVYFPTTAVTRQDGQDNRYGGSILKIPDEYLMLGVQLPQFGDTFNENGLVIAKPLENPADTVKTSVSYVRQGMPATAKLIPVLHGSDGDSGGLSAQIAAIGELGLEEYVLYNDKGEYILP